MSIKRIIGIVLITGGMLIFGCGESLAEMLDDDGDVVTEEEIKVNIGNRYRVGCLIGGGLLSAGVGLVVGALSYVGICSFPFDGWDFRCDNEIQEWGAFYAGFIPTVAIGITISYYTGKHLDRRRAINRIKVQRRQQKKHAFGEQDMTDGFRLQLLKVTF